MRWYKKLARRYLGQATLNIISSDFKAAKKVRLGWTGGLTVFVITLIISSALAYFGRFDLARSVMFCVGTLAFTIFIKWHLRQQFWFWLAMAVIAAIHVSTILIASWSTNWFPAAALAGGMTIDCCVVLVILSALETRLRPHEQSEP